MFVEGITKIGLYVSSPTRMELYLKKIFGLQKIYEGYWKGEYLLALGFPNVDSNNEPILVLHRRAGIKKSHLNYIGFGIRDMDIDKAIMTLRDKGTYIDEEGGDIVYGPENFQVKIDSFRKPRKFPVNDPTIKLKKYSLDPSIECPVKGINHVAVDVAVPTRMLDWLSRTFDIGGRRCFARKGAFIYGAFYEDAPKDEGGRRPQVLIIFKRPLLRNVELNHLAFEFDDAEEAIDYVTSKGIEVDLAGDAKIYAPEGLELQIDSRKTPFPIGHPANDPGPR